MGDDVDHTGSTVAAIATDLGLSVEAPLKVDDPEAVAWDETADLVVVGLGGAGVAAALEALERGLSVIAVDRYEGGGSTAANGGVFYAGGGTVIQREAGEDDDPEEILKYLRIEAGNVVSEATLRRFVDDSPATVDWIIAHGGKLAGNVWKEKTSYPPLDRFLYHSDNSLVASYRARARPAARGHRAHGYDGKKAWGLGKFITGPLTESARRLGLVFHRFSEARQLVQDRTGRVIGVRTLSIPEDCVKAAEVARLITRANKLLAALPPSIPLASLTIGLGNHYLKRAMAIEARSRVSRLIRAR